MYTLSNISEKQLLIISRALELLARVQCGQIDEAFREMRNEEGLQNRIPFDIQNEASKMVKESIGLTQSSSWGAGKFPESADIAFDLHQQIRHDMSWNAAIENGIVDQIDASVRDWTKMVGVCYDEPFYFGTENPVKIEKNG